MTDRTTRDQTVIGGNGARGREMAPRGQVGALPPAPDPHRYSMAQLETETGFNARTIRYYIAQGLLPPAHGRGPKATYDLTHLLRLRMIGRLKADYLPLEDIKTRLGDLSDKEIAAELQVQTRPAEDRWRRVLLHPDVELHVRERVNARVDADFERALEALIKFAETYLPDPDERR